MLLKSNGTAAGTVPVAKMPGSVNSLVNFDGAFYFGSGDRLMKTDGAVTKVVGAFGPPEKGSVANLTDAGGLLYFTFPDASRRGADLYASNGTEGGTTLLKDFVNASVYSEDGGASYLLSNFTALGSKLYFGADDARTARASGSAMGPPRVPRS